MALHTTCATDAAGVLPIAVVELSPCRRPRAFPRTEKKTRTGMPHALGDLEANDPHARYARGARRVGTCTGLCSSARGPRAIQMEARVFRSRRARQRQRCYSGWAAYLAVTLEPSQRPGALQVGEFL